MLDLTAFRPRAPIRAVFTDIDDTLTTHGLLDLPALEAIWALTSAGIAVVPVTGRPAGWCDHLARMWPVAGIVGENGALAFAYERKQKRMLQFFAEDDATRKKHAARLAALAPRILAAVPGCQIASDQPYRLHDLAIDFAEDVPPLGDAAVNQIVALFEAEGAIAKVSSIHVNGWFGKYDKLSMIRRFAETQLGLDLERDNIAAVYAGDSPNDEPAFAYFENSVGVANVRDFSHRLKDPPRFVTPLAGGHGFAQLASAILSCR